MSELAFTLLRLGYLLLLWLMVAGAVMVVYRDIYGTVVTPRGAGRRKAKPRKSRGKSGRSHQPTTLVVTEGPLTGSTLQLAGSAIYVGRSPACTLVLEDDYASGQHARIYPDGDSWWVEDLGSTNGTVVAGNRISAPTALQPGQAIRIGQTILELR